jgi:hypothetical protein
MDLSVHTDETHNPTLVDHRQNHFRLNRAILMSDTHCQHSGPASSAAKKGSPVDFY